MLIFSNKSKVKNYYNFFNNHNDNNNLQYILKNILNKKNKLLKDENNEYDIIKSNFKTFGELISKNNFIYNKIINIIKKNGKINISNLSNYIISTNIFNHYIELEILDNVKFKIPIEYCINYSPNDNIYYLIIEYLKNNCKNIPYKSNILYKSDYLLYKGYVIISSNNEDNKNIIFNIDIYSSDKLLIDQIKCKYIENNFIVNSKNNIKIYFIGNVNIEEYNFDYYTATNICDNINIFLKYINNGIIPNMGYFNYIKHERKNMIRSYSFAYGKIKENVKYDIELVTFNMKKYLKTKNSLIYQKIIMIIWCIKQYNIILPIELWFIICSYLDVKPNIAIS